MNINNDILTELQEWDSPLARYPRTMPYALPHNYFAMVEEQLLAGINDAPLYPASMPYDLPQGYFEKLPGQILQAARQQATPQQVITTRNKTWPFIRWAAAATLIIAIGLGSYRIFTPQPTIQQQLDEIPYEDILAYVQDNIEEYETDNIINNFDNGNTVNLPAGTVNQQAIEYYLLQGEQ